MKLNFGTYTIVRFIKDFCFEASVLNKFHYLYLVLNSNYVVINRWRSIFLDEYIGRTPS